jgi:hypothetical protein
MILGNRHQEWRRGDYALRQVTDQRQPSCWWWSGFFAIRGCFDRDVSEATEDGSRG